MEYPWINFVLPFQNLYTENYKTLLSEIEEDLNKLESYITFMD